MAALAPLLLALAAVVMLMVDDGLLVPALVVLAAGLVLGSTGAVVASRRLHADVDRPAIDLREVALRLGAGEPVGRVSPPSGGPLVPLARALDSAGNAVASSSEELARRADWGDALRRIVDALDFARDDAQVHEVVSHALEMVDDEHPSELLMTSTDSSGALGTVAANRATGSPGCPVAVAGDCLAMRRSEVTVAESSRAIDACPQLRGRPYGEVSAVCVPVSIEGHSVGVLHTVAAERTPPTGSVVGRLAELTRHLGARLSYLRALESSRTEASTDGLTGLPNRRALEASLQQMLDQGRGFVAVLADLDKFKSLNDNFGHEAGDRALQLFARVMQDNVRGHDIVARVGGEEFVVAYPDMTVQGSIEAIERLRTGLATAVATAAVQPFTCSFGVTHSAVGSSVGEILRVADAGLLRAKELGGDQVVYADQALAAEVFDNGEPRGGRPR
ncbi:MAG: GGDEF domain-containing protein [Microthrixaceae bacterium]